MHYRIDLRAWIPHRRTVDPEGALRLSNLIETIGPATSAVVGLVVKPRSEYKSHYRGDNHKGFSGSYRVKVVARFQWDGERISDFRAQGDCGTTHRDWSWRIWLEAGGKTINSSSDSGSESKRARPRILAGAHGAGFVLGFAATNPVTMGPTPDIDGKLLGVCQGERLVVSYSTDRFPSHGVRIFRDRLLVATRILNDASSVNVLGVRGLANIGRRLTDQSNDGSFTV